MVFGLCNGLLRRKSLIYRAESVFVVVSQQCCDMATGLNVDKCEKPNVYGVLLVWHGYCSIILANLEETMNYLKTNRNHRDAAPVGSILPMHGVLRVQPAPVSFVEENMDTLYEVFEDWTEIKSAKRLRGCLLHAARLLRRYGENRLADEWQARIRKMPRRKMDKEEINIILIMACMELKRRGLMPELQGEFWERSN